MCGRFYVDDDVAREIEKIIKQVDEKMQKKKRDIYPTEQVSVLCADGHQFRSEQQTWGFLKFNQKGVIFNARSETAAEKRYFKDALQNRRCIIPACGFYEWDHDKNKVYFTRKDHSVLFMAGLYNMYSGEKRFVILTTHANESVAEIHPRMPVILEKNDLDSWLLDKAKTDTFLKGTSADLKWESEYRQETLNF